MTREKKRETERLEREKVDEKEKIQKIQKTEKWEEIEKRDKIKKWENKGAKRENYTKLWKSIERERIREK